MWWKICTKGVLPDKHWVNTITSTIDGRNGQKKFTAVYIYIFPRTVCKKFSTCAANL